MNTTNTSIKSKAALPSVGKKLMDSKMPTIAGITIPEVAVLGAAGFVLWKNRAKIQTFLEGNGIEVPSFLSGDLSDLIQSGVGLMSGKDSSRGNESISAPSRGRRQDA